MPLVNDIYMTITEPASSLSDTDHTVVLVHGLGSSGDFWNPLVPALAQHFRVVQVDAPGFGRSARLPASPRYDLADATHKIVDALAAVGFHRYALVGHSFGGGLSALYTLEHPERVWGLVLLAPAGFLKSPGSVRFSWVFSPAGWVSRTISRVGLPALRNPRIRAALFAPYVQDPAELTYRDARAMAYASAHAVEGGPAGVAIVGLGLLPRAHGIAVPTLIGWGDADRIVDARLAGQLAEQIADSRVVMYPDAGHALLYEPGLAQVIGRDIVEFLQGETAPE